MEKISLNMKSDVFWVTWGRVNVWPNYHLVVYQVLKHFILYTKVFCVPLVVCMCTHWYLGWGFSFFCSHLMNHVLVFLVFIIHFPSVMISEHVTSNASDSESSYRKFFLSLCASSVVPVCFSFTYLTLCYALSICFAVTGMCMRDL